MAEPILTRYLYLLDETIYSLQQAMLTGSSFEECVHWVGEIYYSGFADKLWRFIFEFYYNFCAIIYPKYERKLTKLYQSSTKDLLEKGCKKGLAQAPGNASLEDILHAINILFYGRKNLVVFSSHSLTPKIPEKIYIGRSPSWYKELVLETPSIKKYRNFVRSLHKRNSINIAFYLKFYEDHDELYEIVKCYFRKAHSMHLADRSLDDIPYTDKAHIIMAVILYLRQDPADIYRKSVFRRYDHSAFVEQLALSNKSVTPAYKTLPIQLQYPISDKIGCFPLSRFSLKGMTVSELYWHHWEYYSYNSPIWRERFDEYGAEIDHPDRRIRFPTDDKYEEFSEKYYFETDEQTKTVQSRAIPNISESSIAEWKVDIEGKLNQS